jgi:hypothetical protein
VVSKQSASALTLSTAATANASGVSLTFYQETGDNSIVTGGTLGYMRAFSGTYPLLLCMKPSAMPGYDTPDKTSVYFTVSSPGAATNGISLAPNSWVAGNRRLPHSSPRQQQARVCMGIVDIEGAALIAFNDGIHLLANRRGGTSGEDFDYRLFTINDTRGCVSYLGLTAGNGWAAYATPEGIVVADKNLREFIISGDIHNPTDGKGDLAYEIGLSAASAAKDSDEQYLSLGLFGSKLALAFRNSQSSDPRVLYYDFSPGVEASGVEELLNPESKRAYIWSPPAIYNANVGLTYIGAMGSTRNASGRNDYIAYDSNFGTANGRIEQVNTTATDNGQPVSTVAVMTPFMPSEFKLLSPQRCEVVHLRSDATSGTSVIEFANDQTPTFGGASLARTLPANTSKTQFQKQKVAIDQGQRGPTDLFWARWRNTIAVTANRIWRLVLQYDENGVE